MTQYFLFVLAGIWLADGISLLIAPRAVMNRVREAVATYPEIFRWQTLNIAAGLMLFVWGWDLAYRPLWSLTASAMIGKGLFLWLGPQDLRSRALDWCSTREDVDIRFWGIGLCTLAVLLLHALGWLGRSPGPS